MFLLKRLGKRFVVMGVIYLIIMAASAYFACVRVYYMKKSYELKRQQHLQHE